MKSKERIDPISPRDISHIKREGRSDQVIELGYLVVRESDDDINVCDGTWDSVNDQPTDPKHFTALPELVWIDSATRFDAPVVGENGVEEYQITTMPADCTVDLSISDLFENSSYTPTNGDYLIKSQSTPGKVEAKSRGELSSMVTNTTGLETEDLHGLIVGRVHGEGKRSGFARCKMTLG